MARRPSPRRRATGALGVIRGLGVIGVMALSAGTGRFGSPAALAAPPAAPRDATAKPTPDPTETSDKPDRPEKSTRSASADGQEAPAGGRRAAEVPDLGQLRAEYDRIREELFKARVRSQAVAQGVYPSKLDARLRWKGGPNFVIRKARFLLDGAELWDSADRAQTDDLIEVAERSVKPGPHALTVQLEIRPKAETKGGTKTGAAKLGYTSEHTFAIVVADSGHTHLLLTGDEDGDPPNYEPELELEIETDK